MRQRERRDLPGCFSAVDAKLLRAAPRASPVRSMLLPDRRQQNNDFNICRVAVYVQCERRYHEQLQQHDLPNAGDGTRSPVPR